MRFIHLICICTILIAPAPAAYGQSGSGFAIHDSTLSLTYKGHTIFSAKLSGISGGYRSVERTDTVNGALFFTATITSGSFDRFRLQGVILGSEEAIACESEPLDKGLKVVRHVYGVSRSALNNAVYDRNEDWLLSIDRYSPNVSILPKEPGRFELEARNWEIVIRFRPYFFRTHRGLPYFRPAEYSVWKRSVVGWCSWFAYFDSIDERSVRTTADVLAEKLKPYGLTYLQIDDGYEQQPIGIPSHWLVPNEKFPQGLAKLASYIASKGLTPGIWTNVAFADSAAAFSNRKFFVRDDGDVPATGNWVGYPLDGSNPGAIGAYVTPVYEKFREDGWKYFKLDALRHLKYEGYNAHAGYFGRMKADRNEALRNVVREVRRNIGNNFLLACWGIRPELTGLVDGCRIGSDGYSYAGLAQFNSFNNIVWRNDPDHIVLSDKEAYRSCTATSLTGSLFMLTDKPEVYRTSPLTEAARRSMPVLFTLPGQVYDVDPSRSSRLALSDIELSGSGPRPFDASSSTTTGLFSLEVTKPYEHWLVLGRLDERDSRIPLKDLGLDEEKEYAVFEFWKKEFKGVIRKELLPGPIDSVYHCQVFCIREAQPHPQLLATNRHISCGALEVGDLTWKDNTLRGSGEIVPNEPYILYIHETGKFTDPAVTVSDGELLSSSKEGEMRIVKMVSKGSGNVGWELRYR
jgi:alpha-galactosidase